jgi:hypothetical protein
MGTQLEDVQLVGTRKAAALLDVSTRTLDKLVAQRVIEPLQLSGGERSR